MLAGKVMNAADDDMRSILKNNPPYAIKLSHHGFDETIDSNGSMAIAEALSSNNKTAFHTLHNDVVQYPYASDNFVVVTTDCGDIDDVHKFVETCARFSVKHMMYDKCNFCQHVPFGTYCRPLRNHGRESNTYLHFVVRYYDNLPADIIFISGNSKHNRLDRLKKMLIDRVPDSNCDTDVDAWKNQSDFAIAGYDGKDLVLSAFRPFKTWYERYVGKWDTEKPGICWNGLMHTTRERILRHPKDFYLQLLDSLSGGEALETGHYFERSMRHIF
jgi:hypothetical protein